MRALPRAGDAPDEALVVDVDGRPTVKNFVPDSSHLAAGAPHPSEAYRAPLRALSNLVFDARLYDAQATSRWLALCYLSCVKLFLLCSYRHIRVSVRAEVARRRTAENEAGATELEEFLQVITSLSRTHVLAIERLLRSRTPEPLPDEAGLLEWASGRSVGLGGDCLRELLAQVVETFAARGTFRPDLARVAMMLAMLPAGVSPQTQARVVRSRQPLEVYVERTVS
jgi:hypothetical protein